MVRLLSTCVFLLAIVLIFGIDEVPVTSAILFVEMIRGLAINLKHLTATCKALDAEILVSYTSAGDSSIPCSANKTK